MQSTVVIKFCIHEHSALLTINLNSKILTIKPELEHFFVIIMHLLSALFCFQLNKCF